MPDPHNAMQGTVVADERMLAGRVAGTLWLSGAAIVALGLLLPGAYTRHWPVVLGLVTVAALWGFTWLVVPWERMPRIAFHLPSALGLVMIGAAVAFTGGAASPVYLLLFFTTAYVAYFFPPREAIPYMAGCALVTASPFLYDPSAVAEGLVHRLWIAVPAFAVLGGVMLVGKRELIALRERARELSLHDSLTGLHNRRALLDLLERHVGGARQSDLTGLLMIDLDDLKQVNTLYGHPGGDRVLCAVGEALAGAVRSGDMVARLGGDEFAIAARNATPEGMGMLADRVLKSVERAGSELDLPGCALSVSVGWALYPDNASTVNELFTAADMSMRSAKILGKGRAQAPDGGRQIRVERSSEAVSREAS